MIVRNRSEITVLAIDSEKDGLLHLGEVLSGAGFTFHCAADAGSAVSTARQTRPDLIISNVNLAGNSGLTICDRIKRETNLQDVPVLFLSSAQAADVVRRSNALGSAYYVRKPFDAVVLLELVARALPGPYLSSS